MYGVFAYTSSAVLKAEVEPFFFCRNLEDAQKQYFHQRICLMYKDDIFFLITIASWVHRGIGALDSSKDILRKQQPQQV